MSDLIEQFPVG